jgi:hypothetical protein
MRETVLASKLHDIKIGAILMVMTLDVFGKSQRKNVASPAFSFPTSGMQNAI